MQKVSKQSLAMIALSILLAISIALTMTFAALQSSKTANGTISFSGDVAIEFGTGFTTEDSGATYKIDLTASTDGITIPETATIGLSSSSVSAYMKITVSALQGDNATSGTVTMARSASAAGTDFAGGTGTTFLTAEKIAKGESVKLSDLIQFTVNMNLLDGEEDVTFTITVDANAAGAYSA